MDSITFVIVSVYLLVFVFTIYACFFANTDARGLNGDISRMFLVKLPATGSIVFKRLLGENAFRYVFKMYNYVVHERNPLLQGLYLLILNAAFMGWMFFGAPMLPTRFTGTVHIYGGYFGVILCQICFYFACSTGPGKLTRDNWQQFDHQPYDGVLYTTGMFCKTCRVPKIARSKHCSLCGYCVPLFDHHCVWLNQCVGELNFRWFLTFLLVNSLFLFYGATIIFLVLISEVFEKNLFETVFINRMTGKTYKATYWMIFQYITNRNLGLFLVFLVAAVMGLAIFAFYCYHLYLMWQGTTINETFKWSSFRSLHKTLKQSYENYKQAQTDGTWDSILEKQREYEEQRAKKALEADGNGNKATQEDSNSESAERKSKDETNASAATIEERVAEEATNAIVRDSVDVGCVPSVAPQKTTAPAKKESKDSGSSADAAAKKKPAAMAEDESQGEVELMPPGSAKFKHPMRVLLDMDQGVPTYFDADIGDFPANIYRTGLWNAMKRAYFPPSEGRKAVGVHKKTE